MHCSFRKVIIDPFVRLFVFSEKYWYIFYVVHHSFLKVNYKNVLGWRQQFALCSAWVRPPPQNDMPWIMGSIPSNLQWFADKKKTCLCSVRLYYYTYRSLDASLDILLDLAVPSLAHSLRHFMPVATKSFMSLVIFCRYFYYCFFHIQSGLRIVGIRYFVGISN